MKLDKDLVREIMLAVEASDSEGGVINLDLPDRSKEQVSYHVMILDEGGFLKAINFSDMSGPDWCPERLTYQGHEFLDTIRDSEVWQRTKAGAEKAGTGSIAFLWEIAKGFGKQVLAERIGIPLA